MEWLPGVVTPSGTIALPLGGRTALRLAAALVRDDRRDAAFADALAGDPALTLWCVLQGRPWADGDPADVDALARWLSALPLERLASTHRPDTLEAFPTLAARSQVVAKRAAELAGRARLDAPRAHLVGLLHLAPQWWTAAGGVAATLVELLPPWLRYELDTVARPATGAVPAGPADCVRIAVEQAADAPNADRSTAPGDGWLGPGHDGLLTDLVARLRRLDALEARFQETLETAKLESLKELAYGAGHEINNPLANISARAQALLPGETDPDRRRMLASINTQAFRAHEMIADMMLFARPPAARAEPVDLAVLLAQVHQELAPQAALQHTELLLQADAGPVEIVGDSTQIAVAVRSLCVNALEALVTGGRIELRLSAPCEQHEVRISVADNGPGIPADIRPRMFDPYFSGREAGRGLGLGLSKCWRIVTAHRGRLDVDSPDARGAVFTIAIPRAAG